MNRRTLLGTLLCLGSTLASSSSAAATFYVSPSGSDSGSCGAISAPCRSISYTVSNRISGGDEVQVRAGTYREVVSIQTGGSASAYTTLRAYTGEKVLIDGSGLSVGDGIVNAYASYVRIEGLEIANSDGGWGLVGYNSHHLQIINNSIHDTYRTGLFIGGDTGTTNVHDVLVQGNTVYRAAKKNSSTRGSSGSWDQGITLANGYVSTSATNIQAIGNTVYNNWGEGLGVWRSSGATVSRNTIYDNFSANIYLDGSSNVVVDRNLIYFTGDSRFMYASNGLGPEGIAFACRDCSGFRTIALRQRVFRLEGG